MGEDYFFYINTIINGDNEKPVLLSAWAVDPNNEADEINLNNVSDSSLIEYAEWDSSYRLRLDFSKPVDIGSVKNRLSVEPYTSLVLETPPGLYASVVFSLAEKPAWQSRFLFTLNPGVRDESGNETAEVMFFRIRTANERSKPPTLVGMRLPLVPGESCTDGQRPQTFTPNNLYADLSFTYDEIHFPYNKAIKFWLELYFDTAPDTEVDTFSLMNLFRVEATNSAITFSPRHIEANDFTWPEPAEGWEGLNRVEVQGFITNTEKSGVVYFRIGNGLEDKRGNRNVEAFRISLLK
jgi:hypothetical protein